MHSKGIRNGHIPGDHGERGQTGVLLERVKARNFQFSEECEGEKKKKTLGIALNPGKKRV